MKEKLIKHWKDPVWSKVISFIIIAIGTILYNFIKSLFRETTLSTEFNRFWNVEIKLWWLLITLAICYLIYFLLKYRHKTTDFIYDSETLQMDRELFNRIRNDLFTMDNFNNLKEHLFSSHSFDGKKIDFVYLITIENKKPDFEFLHPELENVKKEWVKSIQEFDNTTLGNLFRADPMGYIGIPREWDYDRFYAAVNIISAAEMKVCEDFDKLIKKGRRILKI